MQQSPRPTAAPSEASWSRVAFWLLALAMLLYGSTHRSLWADEFHSWHHAESSSITELLASVRTDNHPPLSFLLEWASISVLGPTELGLRLPSLLVGLLFLAMLRRCQGLLAPQPEAGLAPWLVLASSFFFVLFTEARMYALLALCTLGMMLCLAGVLTGGGSPRARWWLPVWISIGLHAHYYFIHQLLLTGVFLGLAWLLQPGVRRHLRQLVLPTFLGLLLFLPWGAYGFWHQLHGDLPPGRAAGSLSALRDGFAHMFHWNASLAGPWAVHYLAIPGTALACLASLFGTLRLLDELRRRGPWATQALMLLTFGIGLPVLTWVISRFSERSTFGWRYLAGAAISVLIIAAIGLHGSSTPRRLLRGLLFATMGSITLINVLSGGHEDHRRLFKHIQAHAQPGDAVLDKPPYDPIPKQEESSWRFYVNRFGQATNMGLPTEYGYTDINKAQQSPRIWVWFRDQYSPWVGRTLRQTHLHESSWQMGPALRLHLFSKSSQSLTH